MHGLIESGITYTIFDVNAKCRKMAQFLKTSSLSQTRPYTHSTQLLVGKKKKNLLPTYQPRGRLTDTIF